MQKVVLMGFMGAGKSYWGPKLAQALGYSFIDLDQYIVQQEGRSIPELFAQKGEAYFRAQEKSYLLDLLEQKAPLVLALGGGTPCQAGILPLLLEQKGLQLIFIDPPLAVLQNRLAQEAEGRPLLAQKKGPALQKFIAQYWTQRRPYYLQAPYRFSGEQLDELLALIPRPPKPEQ
ncbi:shikimate kinase [Saprospira grandis]|uniref:Shikimate kinase n=1 Tax=Saprospira grandis (strain Lewin) TaxID=984262 RepID=H6L1T1_SAPGL|nr:shikimate kinase [Saprospira grandis]AFC26159.1 shikimate kinase [Saprospira grandis str. Lewin]